MEASLKAADEFVRLFSLNEKTVRRYAMSLLADWSAVDDVMQNASIAMLRKFDEYDPAQPFAGWACRFAYYEVLEWRRRAAKRRCFSLSTIELLADRPAEFPREAESRLNSLRQCMAKLSEPDVELIKLRYATSRSVREVASTMGVTAKNLYKKLARIRRNLLACIENTATREEAAG
ncbi:RNA polymerase sigma factor CnrH [Pirellulimonas nuda]|uniref:RNA polymerase sigma factor CnrH n=1 Tax=Pirellulimonas nuda TaxID=2528009 RepID=A0A518DH69_9BACT|nr:sigma-70 family RNA polymerase sigma factor [Pirellulimonas nuda]QDU90817.1 RNA polymerase sigma factor CnrH [Pirellulimonas nuda]